MGSPGAGRRLCRAERGPCRPGHRRWQHPVQLSRATRDRLTSTECADLRAQQRRLSVDSQYTGTFQRRSIRRQRRVIRNCQSVVFRFGGSVWLAVLPPVEQRRRGCSPGGNDRGGRANDLRGQCRLRAGAQPTGYVEKACRWYTRLRRLARPVPVPSAGRNRGQHEGVRSRCRLVDQGA